MSSFGKNSNPSIISYSKRTNNTAELSAIIETYDWIENDIVNGKKVSIMTDSEYSIKCVSSYGEKCSKQGWQKDIPNKELVKKAYELYQDKPTIRFIHIRAHTSKTDIHSIGNENADKLANQAIGAVSCPYHRQRTKQYFLVPFVNKDAMKNLGGMWDRTKKKWFVYDDHKNLDQIMTMFEKYP